MNNFDEWSQIISRFLKAEADLLTSAAKHDIGADSTRTAFIHGVLDPFLPSNYAIGSGRVIDSTGQSSDHIDIVIYRRDFPRLNLPGSSDVFLYESVLATIEVRTKLIRKTLFEALDSCASIAKLNPGIGEQALKKIATQNKLTLNDQNKYVHEHPLLTDRFNLIGRPPGFIYGFNGFQTSPSQLNDNIKIWLEQRREKSLDIDLKSLPSVIATQGCIGWRNSAPLSANSNHLFGIGADTAPIRLIVFQLLYQLNRRLKVTPDSYGLKPSVDAYLNQMAPPEIQFTVGKATNKQKPAPRKTKKTDPGVAKVKAPAKPVPKTQPTLQSKPVTKTKPVPPPKPAPQSKPVVEPQASVEPGPVAESKPASEPEYILDSKPVFETRPVAKSAPKPDPETAPSAKASTIPKPSLGAMHHPEPTLDAMPVPDARLIPEPGPEPESDPYIETTRLPSTASKTASDPVAAKSENQPTAKPEPLIDTVKTPSQEPQPASRANPDPTPKPESDPFIETTRLSMPSSKTTSDPVVPQSDNQPKGKPAPYVDTVKMPAEEVKTATKENPEAEAKAEPEPEPFLETVRMPAHVIEPKVDPFSKTIPGLPDPPKSVH